MSVIRAKLLTFRQEYGGYIVYVFENLERKDWDKHYIKTVRFPNWESPRIQVGEIGYLEYKTVEAGKDSWFDVLTQTHQLYKYSNTIFQDFIKDVPASELAVML